MAILTIIAYGVSSISTTSSSLARIRELAMPVLILIGGRDHPHNIRIAELLETEIVSAAKVTFPGCGHLPFVENPPAFNQHVSRFLMQAGKS